MATKMYNSHLSTILFQCNEYYILDTYIALVHISSEVNDRYLIQTYSDSKADVISLISKYMKSSYKTIYNCVDKLIHLGILSYDNILNSWTLVDMENMTKSKNHGFKDDEDPKALSGYTHIRNFFFSQEFSKMKAREKRLMIYMAQISDSKAADFHNGFSMNLLKPNSPWLKVLKTKCKYYAKYTIEKMLKNYPELFNDHTENLRHRDIAPKRNRSFKFLFHCDPIRKKALEDDAIAIINEYNPNEYALVMDKLRFAEVNLSKKMVMHIVRAISNVREWFLKERISQLIINKYRAIQVHRSRENIKSLPAYAAAVVRSVVNEYNEFKAVRSNNNIRNYELGEYFIEYTNENKDLTYDISSSLALLK